MRISAGMALRAALGASLALNLVFAALLFWQGPARPRGVRGLEARMERALGEEDRVTFRRIMEANRPSYEAAQQSMRQTAPAIAAALGAEPFSEDALRAALQAGREGWRAFSESYENSLTKATAAISPDGRRRLLADLPGHAE
ncbi:periplasmic heavy metal sensor [Roseomonas haemaphysalidis]|uniref:Periplasmic heavy metal sensor n=1 Tax=Roseomonas haemaphysalidis TaxID=2768162 RepID=A0ABS3KQE7_9PROT|nr:periplasmic heavy metal sensor [Roseomonas haemaphysalidis]MBO1078576.1 periplasmic heavy metal sensor [Roseomonas haemaphysalidis]